MKYRLTSDGRPGGTHVHDDNGNEIGHITSIVWSIEPGDLAKMVVTVIHAPAKVESDGVLILKDRDGRQIKRIEYADGQAVDF